MLPGNGMIELSSSPSGIKLKAPRWMSQRLTLCSKVGFAAAISSRVRASILFSSPRLFSHAIHETKCPAAKLTNSLAVTIDLASENARSFLYPVLSVPSV